MVSSYGVRSAEGSDLPSLRESVDKEDCAFYRAELARLAFDDIDGDF